MLIIFDLDDTLIDTSGSVAPFKMQACLHQLIAQGLPIPSLSEALPQLLAMNARSPKSIEAIQAFASSYDPTPEQLAMAVQELTTPLPEDFIVATTPYAKEILQFYHPFCALALITGGDVAFQWDKLKKAGIDPSLFSMIAIPKDSHKGPYYEAAQREFLVPPQEVWVCGDRISMDLEPAHRLSFHTIHMRWGRGILEKGEPWVNHTIPDLRKLKELIR